MLQRLPVRSGKHLLGSVDASGGEAASIPDIDAAALYDECMVQPRIELWRTARVADPLWLRSGGSRCHRACSGVGYGCSSGPRPLPHGIPPRSYERSVYRSVDQRVPRAREELAVDVLFPGRRCWCCLCDGYLYSAGDNVSSKSTPFRQKDAMAVDVVDIGV